MIKKFFLLATALAALSLTMAGCNDETHADPAIVDSMNKQRAAQAAGQKGGAQVPGAPGATNANPYGNPPAGATPPATK